MRIFQALIYGMTLLTGCSLWGQAPSVTLWEVPVSTPEKPLPLAWVGGLNNPQLSAVDLNNDQVDDLYIFDRTGNTQLTFLNRGTPDQVDYEYAPAYSQLFPDLTDWVLLRDFNGDGIQDIFAYANTLAPGIKVYTGYYTSGNELAFRRFNTDYELNILAFPLATGNQTQIYVTNIDYPAVDDIDCDGDLDILTFNQSGGYVEFYQNQSIERGFGLDSLLFTLNDDCWGGIFESGLGNAIDLAPAPGECVNRLQAPTTAQPRHAGSTLLTFDADGNGLKDLLLGDISFRELTLGFNTGTCEQAWISTQDATFPSQDVPADIPLFPAAFYLDVNNDGQRDLLASPNFRLNAADLNALWYYQNTGTDAQPQFSLQTRSLLIEEMIDFGSGARPVPFDYNADGLLDLVVGNSSFFRPLGDTDTRLFLLENTGTLENPAFELIDSNYLDMQQFSTSSFDFTPAFGDLDGDGDEDLLVGEINGQLFYAENTAGPNAPAAFAPFQYGYQNIDIGLSSVPQIIDVNGDELPDLVVGERSGNINFFPNTGTAQNPQFEPDPSVAPNNSQFGSIDTRVPGFSTGYSSAWMTGTTDGPYLLTGSRAGPLAYYPVPVDDLQQAFVPITEQLGNLRLGSFTHPATADFNGDGLLDLVVGNFRGGISLFQTNIDAAPVVSVGEAFPDLTNIELFPNPATDQVTITGLPTGGHRIRLLHLTGQVLRQWQSNQAQQQLPLRGLPQGAYLLQVELPDGRLVHRRLLVQ